jgi:carbon monoxide dehydrogenase subunit G
VRADFRLRRSASDEQLLVWEQQLAGTPFERLFSSAETRVRLEPVGIGTRVTLELDQRLSGFFPRFGGFMVRRAAAATLEQALDGLERIGG